MSHPIHSDIQSILEESYQRYHRAHFIADDPVSIPHRFDKKEDIEITALWTALLSWGQRKTIIDKATSLFGLMDDAPYDFIMNHHESDLSAFTDFKHRTFQPTDTLYFITALRRIYRKYESLEVLFTHEDLKEGINHFHKIFFDDHSAPVRTKKHLAAPYKNSTCKRIVMFLRWMVRRDSPVDFGLWTEISPSQLFLPLDIHVERVSRSLGLLSRKTRDWHAVEELTTNLRAFDADDPSKYDYALFGLGVEGLF